MHVYRVTCDIYVTADSPEHAESVIDHAISAYAPGETLREDNASIDMLYVEKTERCKELEAIPCADCGTVGDKMQDYDGSELCQKCYSMAVDMDRFEASKS